MLMKIYIFFFSLFNINSYDNYNYIINSTAPNEYPLLSISPTEVINNKETKYLSYDFESKEIKNLTENLIKFDINKIKSLIEEIKMKKNESIEITKEEEIEYYDTILKNIEEGLTSGHYDTSELDQGKDDIIETEKIKIILTTIQNQKNKINNNRTIIDLDECETLLRNFYNLTHNQTLYMKQLEITQEGMKIPKVEYDLYCKLYGRILEKLDLSVCQNSKISLSIPVKINDNLDKLNSSSGYYNDICYTATTKCGTDISLKDRKNEYANNTVCQEGCDFADYDYTSQKAKCSCEVKGSSSSFADMNIDKKKLLDNFKDIKNVANLNFLVCHESLFSKQGLLKNIGCYLFISFIIFHIINIFIFYVKQFNLLKNKIDNIIFFFYYIYKSKKNKEKKEQKDKKNNTIEKDIQLDDINNNEINIYKKQNQKKEIIQNRGNPWKSVKICEIRNKKVINKNNNNLIINNINSKGLLNINNKKKFERSSAKIIHKTNLKFKGNNISNINNINNKKKFERSSIKIIPKTNLKSKNNISNINNKKVERNPVKILSGNNSKVQDKNIKEKVKKNIEL